ncbi:hypothetical protein PENSPDRAFT_694904 [Peniophora sp. CONT]|nr:hypothetical protein PENSPDRAFT_694904 [Peniophora sp. CONT]
MAELNAGGSIVPYNPLAHTHWRGVDRLARPEDIQNDRMLRQKVIQDMNEARALAAAEDRDRLAADSVLPHLRHAVEAARSYASNPSGNPYEHRATLYMHRRRIAGLHQEWMLAGQGEEAGRVVTEAKLWILDGHRFNKTELATCWNLDSFESA